MSHIHEHEIRNQLQEMPVYHMDQIKKDEVLERIVEFEQKWSKQEGRKKLFQWTKNIALATVMFVFLLVTIFSNGGKEIVSDLWSNIIASAEKENTPSDQIQAADNDADQDSKDTVNEEPKQTEDEDITQLEEEEEASNPDGVEPIKLHFEPVANQILSRTPLPPAWEDKKTIPINFTQPTTINVHLFENKEGHFLAYLEDHQGDHYFLGEFGNSSVMDINAVTAEPRKRWDIGAYLAIEGGGGAITENKAFIQYHPETQEWVKWDMTNTTEEDLNHDGKPLLVVTSRGSALPFVSIIRWNETTKEFESADVAKSARHELAYVLNIDGKAWIKSGKQTGSSIYRYREGKLIKLDRQESIIVKVLTALRLHENKPFIRTLLGTKYKQVTGAMDNTEMWRYDIVTSTNYYFSDGGSDEVDLEGIKNGDVIVQLFVEWAEDDVVESYSAYYEQYGRLYNYRLFSDGSEKTEEVFLNKK